MTTNVKTTVLDAGGRYGLHPTWKPFTGELDYYSFEPDPEEARRLKAKYAHRANEIKIIDCAVAEKDGKLKIDLFRNRAMSSTCIRKPISALYLSERQSEVEIVEQIEVDAVSVDSFCEKNKISTDFLKIDTEGNEYQILEGSTKQLENNILGVRSAVTFDYIFENMPLFNTLHEYMLKHDFYLLNLDYTGKGDYQNEFVKADGRYGILASSDAVWLKRPEFLFKETLRSKGFFEAITLKYAAFCYNNHAPDVAIDVLLKGRKEHNLNYDRVANSRLYQAVNVATHKLFYSLKWQPGQSLAKHKELFFEIFGKKMKTANEYMESLELNPD